MNVPATVDEAVALQVELASAVVREPPPDFAPRTAAGLDVAYATDSPLVAAAVVTVSVATGEVLESATAVAEADFPYEKARVPLPGTASPALEHTELSFHAQIRPGFVCTKPQLSVPERGTRGV